jgi:hypothetical protein
MKNEKLTGPFILLQSGKELQCQGAGHKQHEITAHIGNCPVMVAAVPVGSTNGIDGDPVFRVTNSEFVRVGKLLAAAPELLKALEMAKAVIYEAINGRGGKLPLSHAWHDIGNAIDKATGGN